MVEHLPDPRLMGPAMRKCEYCDIPFPVSRLNKKYCNDLCRSRAHRMGVTGEKEAE